MKILRAAAEETTSASAPSSRAKQYSRIKLTLSLIGTVLSFAVTIVILITGISLRAELLAYSFARSPYLALLLFAAMLGVLNGLISFPLGFYSGYILEHRYSLSNQNFLHKNDHSKVLPSQKHRTQIIH